MTEIPQLNGVILVSFEYPPRRLSFISDVVFRLATFCRKKNLHVWVVTFDDWRSEITNEEGVVVHRIPNWIPNNLSDLSMIMNLKNAYQTAIAAIMHEHRVEVIHFFGWQTLPLLVPWGGNIKPKIVYTATTLHLSGTQTTTPYFQGLRKIEEKALRNIDLILMETYQLQMNAIEAYALAKEKLLRLKVKEKKFASKIFEQYLQLVLSKRSINEEED